MSIQVQNIHKAFGNFVALDNLTLDFPAGELVALLGPSGCGKTTLLRVIAGLEQADSGKVLLDGEDASDTHVRERQVGFVFQHYALFRHMTVFDNVAFGLRVKPRKQRPPESAIRKKVHELLQLVQLDWLADRYPPQRIALARALAVEPRVLLLDEPFGALDAKVRKELRRWLRRLHDELHITSIFVTHDQEEALEVADQIVVMNKGNIEQIGTPDQVYDQPATPFVYSFLGSVNLFHGRVDGEVVHVGPHQLEHGGSDVADGTNVVAFARPHELTISKDPAARGVYAIVERVLTFGATSRVELIGLDINDEKTSMNYEVELTRLEMAGLNISEGDHVYLVTRKLSVFEHKDA